MIEIVDIRKKIATTGRGNTSSGAGGQDQDNRVQQMPLVVNPLTGQPDAVTQLAQQTTYATPTPSNEMGNAKPLFSSSASNAGNIMFGDVEQRQRSLQDQDGVIQSALFFKDQTGDGKITRADVIKARTEGYQK